MDPRNANITTTRYEEIGKVRDGKEQANGENKLNEWYDWLVEYVLIKTT